MAQTRLRFSLVVTLLAACTSLLPVGLAFADKQTEVEAVPTPATAAVFAPDVVVEPDPASSMTLITWQHVVALRLRGTDEAKAPLILVSCAPKPGGPSPEQVAKSCSQEMAGWVPDLIAGGTLTVGQHTIELLAGPAGSLARLSGPWRRAPKPGGSSSARQDDKKSTEGQPPIQSALEIPAGWESKTTEEGLLSAWPAAASESRVRIARKPLLESLEQASSTTKDPGKQSAGIEAGEPLRMMVAFERAKLLASEAGQEGSMSLRLRFLAPVLPDTFKAAVDTGAVSFAVPDGWELLYFEERLWFRKGQPGEAGASDRRPSLWPWKPTPSTAPAAGDAQKPQGSLAIGARSGSAITAVAGCLSTSQPVQPLLPALQAVLDGLHLASRVAVAEDTRGTGAVKAATVPMESFDPALSAPSVSADSPESADLLASQQAEVQARNDAILQGADDAYFDAPPTTGRMDEAVERFNQELLNIYPDGGEPPLWAQTRLDELQQTLFNEEVIGQQ